MPAEAPTASLGPWTILFAGVFPWESGLRRDFHRVLGELARRGHRPVYVEPAVPFGRAGAPSTRPARDGTGVTLLTPRTVRGQRLRPIAAINRSLQVRAVRRAWDGLQLPEPDLVIVHPPARSFFWDAFPHALRVYRNYDLVEPSDARRMVAGSDVVLTASPRYARTGTFGPERTRYLPQSCDEFAPLAHERNETDPVAGTMGTFGSTTDLELLAEVTRRATTIRFLFQGTFGRPETPRERVIEKLLRPNVRIVERSDSDLDGIRGFLRSIRVGLCPYLRNEWTLHSAPERFLAFLRAGLPVVTTDFSPDALEPFRDLPGVFVAEGPGSFAALLPAALEAGRDPSVVAGLVAAAEPYLATNLAPRFEGLIGEAFSLRG